MKLKLKGTFTDLNTYINKERSNRFMAAKIKADETERVIWEVIAQGVKPVTDYPTVLYFRWFMPNKKKDPDNIAFARKFILDGLVKANKMTGDGCKQIAGFCDMFAVDSINPRVEITDIEGEF